PTALLPRPPTSIPLPYTTLFRSRLDATRTILHMAPISFDAATLEVWGALLHGARCILFPERIPTPKSIGAVVHKHKVTTAWLTADRKSTRLNSSHQIISYAAFCV